MKMIIQNIIGDGYERFVVVNTIDNKNVGTNSKTYGSKIQRIRT